MELLTIKDVSKKLKMNTTDTYKLIKSGNLQALKLGSLKVSSYELERFIREATGKDFSDLENVKELVMEWYSRYLWLWLQIPINKGRGLKWK